MKIKISSMSIMKNNTVVLTASLLNETGILVNKNI